MQTNQLPTTLVLGASENPLRYSHRAVRMLQEAQLPIVAVGRREGEIEGTPILKGMPEVSQVDTVTLYVGARHQAPFMDYILSLKPRRVIFNPGTENPELEEVLHAAGIAAEHACTLVLLSTDQYLDGYENS